MDLDDCVCEGRVGVASGTGWTSEGSELKSRQGKEFPILHIVETVSGAHTKN
jgi:hypothetical protein